MIGVYNYTVLFTLFGTISGVVGIREASLGNISGAMFCLLLCGFFDMFDGCIARTKKDRTEFEIKYGIQLDSLSDVICFGALPTVITLEITKSLGFFQIFSIFYLVAAISRLTFFNVEEELRRKKENTSRKTYSGIPVTVAALILPILYLLKDFTKNSFPLVFLIGVLIYGMLQISKLKVPHLNRKGLIICLLIGLCIIGIYLLLQFL